MPHYDSYLSSVVHMQPARHAHEPYFDEIDIDDVPPSPVYPPSPPHDYPPSPTCPPSPYHRSHRHHNEGHHHSTADVDDYPSIENDDHQNIEPHNNPHHRRSASPRTTSHEDHNHRTPQRRRHEPLEADYAHYNRQESPYISSIPFATDRHSAREAYFTPIEPEIPHRSHSRKEFDLCGLREALDVDYSRHARQASPYCDSMGVGEERRFASGVKVEEGGAADPYVGALGFDPGRVEFEPVDVESGYFVRRRREGRGKGVLGTVMVVADRTSGRLI